MPILQRPLVAALALFAVTSLVEAQYRDYDRTTPVPILKQINRHNEDGSYSYGYEAADGSFKIETKHPTGEVFGKYGYVDDSGQVREVEYGASKRGFEPAGNDINVAPPTLTNNVAPYQGPDGYDDGQYREDPSVYYKDERYNRPRQRTNSPAPQYSSYQAPQAPQAPQPRYNPAPQQSYYNPPAQQNYYSPPPQQNYYNPTPQQPNYYRPPIHVDQNLFRGHPARNFDVNTGSYSVGFGSPSGSPSSQNTNNKV